MVRGIAQNGIKLRFEGVVHYRFEKNFVFSVIYDDDLTDAFFRTVYKLLSRPPDKTVFIALERRYATYCHHN